jgi:hypothetical protein
MPALKGDFMATVCGHRMFGLFVIMCQFLSGLSLAWGNIDLGDKPRRETVQQVLSNQKIDDSEAIKLIFRGDDDPLPALLKALREGKNTERASLALAYLGGPKERKVLRDVIAAETNKKRKWLIASFLAGALVEPASAEEWQFLETCLRGYRDEDKIFASFSAAVALGINGSPRALHLLQAAIPSESEAESVRNNDAIQQMEEAIRWINQSGSSNKSAVRAENESDSEQIKQLVLESAFCAENPGERRSVDDIVFTRDRSRALVSVQIYRGPSDAHGYDIVLARRSGLWKFAGAWFSWVA